MRQAARGKAEARASLLETQLAACTAASDQLTQRAAESELVQAGGVGVGLGLGLGVGVGVGLGLGLGLAEGGCSSQGEGYH